MAMIPAEGEPPSGRRLLAKLHGLRAAIPAGAGLCKEQIDADLEGVRNGWVVVSCCAAGQTEDLAGI
ncbi:MAG: hypothetical protein ACKOZT_13925 [Cyanobium sp.]